MNAIGSPVRPPDLLVVFIVGLLVFTASMTSACGDDIKKSYIGNSAIGSDAGTSDMAADAGFALTCSDGVLNGDETDLDCGGSCAGCDDGGACDSNGDCASAYCVLAGVCEPQPLATGQPCLADDECASNRCKDFGGDSFCTESCTDTCPGQDLACFRSECTPDDYCEDPDGDGFGFGPGCGGQPCERCSTDATCSEQQDGSFLCLCNAGFDGDGEACADVDECSNGTNDCAASASCTNTPGGFECACAPGFDGDGTSCTDVDECATGAANCAPNASCTNLAGTFSCACDAGFAGDGTTCADVDECATGSANCDPNAGCTNFPGSFTCACETGFRGDGTTCSDIDECAEGSDNCDLSAICTNVPGSFSCACPAGFTGDGVVCNEVDECAMGLDNCSFNASCTNTAGSFTCTCAAGYQGDGVTCNDANECAANTDNCSPNATCTNTVGSFDCACNSGFQGDGITCAGQGDTCALAYTIGSLPFSASGNTAAFGVVDDYAYGDNQCPGDSTGNGAGQPDQAYSFTAPSTGDYIVDIPVTNFDVRAYVVSDCSNVGGTCEGADFTFPFTVTLTAGVTYYVIIDGGFTGDEGTYTLQLHQDACANANPCDPVATCTSTFSGATCACPAGYSGDGFTCTAQTNTVEPGEVVINEIMQNPLSQLDSDGEWFELYNASGRALDLDGCRVLSQTSTGDDEFIIAGSPGFAAGDYMVFATSSFFAGSADYDFNGAINLNNTSDTIELRCLTSAGSEQRIDFVAWDDGATFPDPVGASMNLDPASRNVTANDLGSSWCPATTVYYMADTGTPGSANVTCP